VPASALASPRTLGRAGTHRLTHPHAPASPHECPTSDTALIRGVRAEVGATAVTSGPEIEVSFRSAHVLRRSRAATAVSSRVIELHSAEAQPVFSSLPAAAKTEPKPCGSASRFKSQEPSQLWPLSSAALACFLVHFLASSRVVVAPPARPNPSLKLTRYGSRRLAAPGAGGIMPSAAKRRLPTRAAYLER
jgi:hypothetical protein